MEDKKVLLSVKDLEVKFRVRGRILTAIRGISLDIYENESIAIVGESGSGKSVFTKTFAGMLDSNGFISQGELIFNDDELADTVATPTKFDKFLLDVVLKRLNKASKLELGADIYQKILALKAEKKEKFTLSEQEHEKMQDEIDDLKFRRTEAYNLKLTLNTRKERDKVKETNGIISDCDKKIKALEKTIAQTVRAHKQAAKADLEFAKYYAETMAKLKEEYKLALQGEITEDTVHRNEILGKEIYLSVGRYGALERFKLIVKLILALRKAMRLGVDLTNDEQLNQIFDPIAFRLKFLDGRNATPRRVRAQPRKNQVHKGLAKDPRYAHRNRFPGSDDVAQPDHNNRQANLLNHHQAPTLLGGRGEKKSCRIDEEGGYSQCGKPL